MTAEIELSNKPILVKVSQEDYERVKPFSWYAKKSRWGWYACASVRMGQQVKTLRLHRFIMDCPEGMEVDHLNGDHWDNRRENLEIVEGQENLRREWARIRAEQEGTVYDPIVEEEVPF